MNKVIKYTLKEGVNEIETHHYSKVLDVKFQRGVPTLWALEDLTYPLNRIMYIQLVKTGEEVDLGRWFHVRGMQSDFEYISTLETHHMRDDDYVLHAFRLYNYKLT